MTTAFTLDIFLKVYLLVRQSDRERGGETEEDREGEKSSICWLTIQMGTIPRAGQWRSQEPGTPSVFDVASWSQSTGPSSSVVLPGISGRIWIERGTARP